MISYKVLNRQVYPSSDYSIVTIRSEDRYLIMQWRNEQIYHLRQNKPLTKEDQDSYFENVVTKLFDLWKLIHFLLFYQTSLCAGSTRLFVFSLNPQKV